MEGIEKLSTRKIKPNSGIFFDFTGCKLNRHDIELLCAQAETLGFRALKTPDEADIIVLDTCCVTNKAARSSRAMIRRYRRLRSQAYIVVTGCYSEIEKEEVRHLDIDLLIYNAHKLKFINFIHAEIADVESDEIGCHGNNSENGDKSNLDDVGWYSFYEKTRWQSRPHIKIQDGCDFFCHYCIIPFARGVPRSVPRNDILTQVRLLASTAPEINLCGVNLGRYNDGVNYGLYEILSDVSLVLGLKRIRLSSIEPLDLDDKMLRLILENKKFCAHLHIPLQGTTDKTLTAMGRRYSFAEYSGIVQKIKDSNPNFCLGADVISGYPGESEEDFSQGLENLKNLPLDYLHVFTYSVRPGTVAAKLAHQVSGEEKRRRTNLLRLLSDKKWQSFLAGQIGQRTTVVIERGRFGKHLKGLSSNYVPVYLESCHDDLVLQELELVLKDFWADGLLADLV